MHEVSARNFLGGLSPEHFDVFRAVMRPIDLADGDLLCREGDLASAAWFVERGALETVRSLPGGGERLIATAKSGELVGELGLLVDTRRTASLRAKGPTRVLEVDRAQFGGVVAHFHAAALGIMRRLVQLLIDRLQQATRAIYVLDDIQPPGGPERLEDPLGTLDEAGPGFEAERFLSALPFFETYATHDLAEFLDFAKPTYWRLPRGRCISRRGRRPGACQIVVRGAVELRAADDIVSRRLALLSPGSSIGVPPLLSGEAPLAFARVREDAVLMELDAERLRAVWDEGHRIGFHFATAVARDMARQIEHITRVLARIQQQRLVQGRQDGAGAPPRPRTDPAPGGSLPARLWVLDTESGAGDHLVHTLEDHGFETHQLPELGVLLSRISASSPDQLPALIVAAPNAAEGLLSQMGRKAPPVLVVAPKLDVDEAVRCVRGGAADYLQLDDDHEPLIDRIRLHLDRENFRA